MYRKGLFEVLPSSSSNSWDHFTVGKHHSFSFPKFNNQGGAHAMLPILPEAKSTAEPTNSLRALDQSALFCLEFCL